MTEETTSNPEADLARHARFGLPATDRDDDEADGQSRDQERDRSPPEERVSPADPINPSADFAHIAKLRGCRLPRLGWRGAVSLMPLGKEIVPSDRAFAAR